MKFRARLVFLLTAATVLSGCSHIGLGKKDQEPEAPLTQVSFSLYASTDVNPNPDIPQTDTGLIPPVTGATLGSEAGKKLYQVNLTGDDRLELITKLNILLEQLQADGTTKAGTKTSGTTSPAGSAGKTPAPASATVAQQGSGVPLPPHVFEDRGTPWVNTDSDEWQYAGRGDSAAREIATPIRFKILQLKDDSLFLNADHEQLAEHLKKTLGRTYLDDDDYILQPGQFKFIDYADIHKKTRYIAVFADFHEQDGAIWKQVLRLEPDGHKYALLVSLHDNTVTIAEESYRQPQPRPTK